MTSLTIRWPCYLGLAQRYRLLRGTAPAQDTAEDQGTDNSQGTANLQGTAAILKSPNDYTPTDAVLTHLGGDGGTFGFYMLEQGIKLGRNKEEGTLSEEHYVQDDYTADPFFEDIIDKDAAVTPDFERKRKEGSNDKKELETLRRNGFWRHFKSTTPARQVDAIPLFEETTKQVMMTSEGIRRLGNRKMETLRYIQVHTLELRGWKIMIHMLDEMKIILYQESLMIRCEIMSWKLKMIE
ncbi:hypothetical protein Tco_0628936 [Tanacetum coccineum]|uniref:Uncharacterized protein n=1 Tax=Tanacetum coccineum TaxID=301880 RepID=A0ABQ4WRQ1_9ASTR